MTKAKTEDQEIVDNEIAYRIDKRYGRTLADAIRKLGKQNNYDIAKIAQLLFAAFYDTHIWIEDKGQAIAELRFYRQRLSEQIYHGKIWKDDPFATVDLGASVKAAREAEHVLEKGGL